MSYKVTGKITQISDIKTLNTGAKVLEYLIDTGAEYNNLYQFNIYKKAEYSDQVDKFVEFNKVGDLVEVEFNISTKEYQGKYYTNLSHWRADKVNEMPKAQEITASDFAPDREDGLPF